MSAMNASGYGLAPFIPACYDHFAVARRAG
jgi:hypothetical protein